MAAAGLLPHSLLGFCTEVYSKLRPPEDKDRNEEATQSGQDHIFDFYQELSEDEKRALDEDYDTFKVEDFEEAWNNAMHQNEFGWQGVDAEPPRMLNWELKRPPVPGVGANLTKMGDVSERKEAVWRSIGLEMYFKSRVAIIIMSGGKDSRMGDGMPKGVLDIGLLSGKSIFQLYIERIIRLQHLVQRKFKRAVCIPIYIMCNSENRSIIEEFFHENEFFGIREQDVLFFTQGNFPLCDSKGKILLREKHRIAQEPNGNGGLFKALVEEGMVSDMKSRGVTSLYVSSVDNVLAMVGDPCFVGYCEICKAEAGVKAVEKITPEEQFGVFCSKTCQKKFEDIDGDGRLDAVYKVKASVVEFFELPDDLKKRRNRLSSGATPLALSCGSISQYYFKVDFVKRLPAFMARHWHAVPRAASYVKPKTGERVPAPGGRQKNANRLEMFVFDAFENTKCVVGLEVERCEFANVKNVAGQDSPQTAVVAMGRLHQQWIVNAGGRFIQQRIATDREDTKCEISPLVSYGGEDLGGQFPEPLVLPFYLPSLQELVQFSAASSVQTRRHSTHYLDWYSDLAQRELEVEMHLHLGGVMDAIEDPSTVSYMGERAAEEEALPPTPRQALQKALRRANCEAGAENGVSARSGGGDSAGSGASGPGSARELGSGRSPGQEAEPQETNTSPRQLEEGGPVKEQRRVGLRDLEDRPKSQAVAASKAKTKPGTKKREAFWGEPPEKGTAPTD